MITITHEMELEALEGRVAYLIDPHGEKIGYGILTRHNDAGRVYWRIVWDSCHKPTNLTIELADIADIAGTVIELRRCR